MNPQNLQQIRFDVFQAQDQETGAFDVIFDIDGKRLFAHKFMLITISTTFESMISERWISKDVPIPLDTYSFDDFYQLLSFVYSEECLLTDDNIFNMVDIAEFYHVPLFKTYCEEYLLKLECNRENVVHYYDIATKYFLDKFKKSIIPVIAENLSHLLQPDHLPLLSSDFLLEILKFNRPSVKHEIIFEKVYEWAEYQAKTKMDSNLTLEERTKEIFANFMPLFDVDNMELNFIIKFIIAKSLLPSGPELSKTLLNSAKVHVQISDGNGRKMKGTFSDPENMFEEIQHLTYRYCSNENASYFYWKTSRQNHPSQKVNISFGIVDWHLVYDNLNNLALKRYTQLVDTDYLIAKMFDDFGFAMHTKCKIEVFRS